MALYDYACECGLVTEARRGINEETIPCPACGQSAKRQAVYRVSVAFSGLPTRAGVQSESRERRHLFRDYREAAQEVDYAYSQTEKDVGHPIESPNYYQIGKARAEKLRKAGVKSIKEVRR